MLHSPVMPNQASSSDIRRYAIAGAKARVVEITRELDAIRRAFPELRETRGPRRRASIARQETGGDVVALARNAPSQHHVGCQAQSGRRADEEVLGSTPGRSCHTGCRGRRNPRDSEAPRWLEPPKAPNEEPPSAVHARCPPQPGGGSRRHRRNGGRPRSAPTEAT